MGVQLTLTDIQSGFLTATAHTANNTLTEIAMNKALDRTASTDNAMAVDLDMGLKDIINTDTLNAQSLVLSGTQVGVAAFTGINIVKFYATLNNAVIATDIVNGDVLNIVERTSGNGGGATWDVVLSSSVTENTFNIVQATGVGTLSLVLRIKNATIDADSFGLVATSLGDTSAAIANLAAFNAAILVLSSFGGTIQFGVGYYYVSGQVTITVSGIYIKGAGDPYSGASQSTHIATTQLTGDVIQVNDSVRAVNGFRLSDLAIIGNKSVVGATDGSCLNIECSAGATRAHSLINIHDASFLNAKEHAMIWQAVSPSNFIFNSRINNINTRTSELDGVRLIGQISQVAIDKVYSENNTQNQYYFKGVSSIQAGRLTVSLAKATFAGFHLEDTNFVDISNIYMEDTAGANFKLLSNRSLNILGGGMDQLLSTSEGILIGTNSANDPNKDIKIDIPGWTRGGAVTANYIDLTQDTGGVVVDGLYLGMTADSVLDSNDIDGYSSTFFADRIKFMYENFRDLPTILVDSNAGTSATAIFTAGTVSTDRKGRITLTTGSGAYSVGAQLAVTFNAPKDNPPIVILQPEGTSASLQNQTLQVNTIVTTTGFTLVFAVAEASAISSQWSYTVVGEQL